MWWGLGLYFYLKFHLLFKSMSVKCLLTSVVSKGRIFDWLANNFKVPEHKRVSENGCC